MKQRITIDDIRKLTQKQQVKLRQLWHPSIGDTVNDRYDNSVMFVNSRVDDYNITLIRGNSRMKVTKEECLPLLNIGQMIELLEDKQIEWRLDTFTINQDEINIKYNKNELCDTLWFLIVEFVLINEIRCELNNGYFKYTSS